MLAPILPFTAEEFHQHVFRASLFDQRYHLAAFHLDPQLLGAYRELAELLDKLAAVDRRGKKCSLHVTEESPELRRRLQDLGLEDAKLLLRVGEVTFVEAGPATQLPARILGSVRFKKCQVRLVEASN